MKSKKSPDFDGFVTVTYKGKKKHNCRKLTPINVLSQQQEPEDKNGMFDKRKFESAVEDVRNSRFLMNFKENLLYTLGSHVESDRHADTTQSGKALSMNNNNEMLGIVCYGLGHFASCVIARYQLAFLLILRDILSPRTISIYDPVFSNEEKNVLQDFDLTVLDVNEEAKQTVFRKTIFFMPHCELPLYNNLLWANWSKDSLSKLILIGNSFQQYVLDRTEKILKEKAVYVNYASKFVTEIRITNDFKFSDIFNNLSLHCFHTNALSEVPFEVWNDNVEPVCDDDEEIIKKVS